ncbi:polysaccharide deacetylase family protein [Paenibacillus sp. CF384]|uniref:polysaccharide deacetylase family protein n=1 Tax=Paenibacillus sp. CF384 TaxID=1884382 RepID=UPI0008945826|nr:polysaccharide deacetylase family protein [Paenibacillus sp. CF384]SDX67894.1 Peptidoglycan/xylan/chitin deacetylase, PgdA/CDA1 family [Paenibacillus sp. CF384]
MHDQRTAGQNESERLLHGYNRTERRTKTMFGMPVTKRVLVLLIAWIALLSSSSYADNARPSSDGLTQAGSVRKPGQATDGQGINAGAKHAQPSFNSEQKRRKKRSAVSWVKLQQQFPGSFVVWGPRGSRRVALTFDDVPDPRYTPQVLEILARYKVRATFFVVGNRAAKHPALVRRMRKEGHIIGNHSYDHAVFSRISRYAFEQQIWQTDWILRPLAGYSPKFIRPPYGEITPQQVDWLRRRGYIVVNWDVDSVDWKGLDSNSILINIKRTLQPGSIILQHAGGGEGQDLSGTVAALPKLIRLLRSKGYQIVTLPELLNKPEARGARTR